MRVFLILPLSAVLLGACATTHQSPIYEQSTNYQGDLSVRHQYANAAPVLPAPTVVTYESAPAQSYPVVSQSLPAETYAQPIEAYFPAAPVMATAPTDSAYTAVDVSGTPGFMAMQQSLAAETVQAETVQAATPILPEAQFITAAPLGAAGTPIAYDYTRNLVAVDAATTGQRLPQTSRILPSVGQNYTVQQGDTVYSLSRKTCVGVNVIQSMNGLSSDFAIKIGQSITLPASVC